MISYGYTAEHPYYQFTGDSDFKKESDMTGPISLFSNVYWQVFKKFGENDYLTQWSYGFEIVQFSSTSESAYTGTKSITAPLVDMNLTFSSLAGKIYFFDVWKAPFQPFLGLSYGWMQGEISSSYTGISARTNLGGFFTTQSYGANVLISEQTGVVVELRNTRANHMIASNDPFGQGFDYLDFTGIMLNMTGYFRF